MNKTFEEQVKNQVQYPEYIEPDENQKKLSETKKKINNMKKLITIKKKELNNITFKEKNVNNKLMKRLGKLVDKSII